jgi:hypothetical protein
MSERVVYTISPLGLLALIAGLVGAAIFPIAILLNLKTAGLGAGMLLIAALMVSIVVGK